MSEYDVDGDKAFDQTAMRRSVIDTPPAPNSRNGSLPSYDTSSQIFWIGGQYVDEISPFGGRGKLRDTQLRSYTVKEPIFASALGIMCSRNAGFSWKIDAPPRTAAHLQDVLDNANMGEGWHDLIIKTSIDLYTQDTGAFWEIVRAGEAESSPVIGINHLDSARCYHTGNKLIPVIYLDRMGKYHYLRRHNVITFADMPVPSEGLYGMQYSALSRMLMAMQIQRNINVYKFEKTSGRNAQAIHIVKGITSQQLQDAMNTARSQADAAGLSRWSTPILLGSIDPRADVGHDTIEMVGLPDNYDEEVQFKHYINQIAMAFMSDYQEFAPLPGGGLGTGAQSEMLHLKSQGKGPGLFMKLITHAINMRVFPQNSRFWYDEQDLEAEKSEAEVRAVRAQTRAVRIASGEITPQVARQLANDDGDLPQELLDLMGEADITENETITDDTQSSYLTDDQGATIKPGTPAPGANITGNKPTRAPVISPPTPLGPKQRRPIKSAERFLDLLNEPFSSKTSGKVLELFTDGD